MGDTLTKSGGEGAHGNQCIKLCQGGEPFSDLRSIALHPLLNFQRVENIPQEERVEDQEDRHGKSQVKIAAIASQLPDGG